eukprot:15433287-Alexandrium_andersonii.AAC.1
MVKTSDLGIPPFSFFHLLPSCLRRSCHAEWAPIPDWRADRLAFLPFVLVGFCVVSWSPVVSVPVPVH